MVILRFLVTGEIVTVDVNIISSKYNFVSGSVHNHVARCPQGVFNVPCPLPCWLVLVCHVIG